MFTFDQIQALLKTIPFAPFRLHLSDGSSVDVLSREFVSAGRRYAIIGIPDPRRPDAPFDRHVFVYYMHVTRTETLVPGPMPGQAPPPEMEPVAT